MGKTHRGTRGGRKKRQNRSTYDQALDNNALEYTQYLNWITALALTRFEYRGLPDTCDARYMELQLIFTGAATIAHSEGEGDIWLSLAAVANEGLTVYGKPQAWQARGANGLIFRANWESGSFIYDRQSRVCLWGKLDACARRLARYSRTENVNLMHQFTPYLVTAPEEQVQSVQNVFAQTVAGQPAVVGYDTLSDLIRNGIEAVNTGVEWIGDKLQAGALGTWGEVFRILGIPHLQYEKRERLITDEAETTLAPSRLMLDDALQARREGLEHFNRISGYNATVEVNPDIMRIYNGEPIDQEGTGDDVS